MNYVFEYKISVRIQHLLIYCRISPPPLLFERMHEMFESRGAIT